MATAYALGASKLAELELALAMGEVCTPMPCHCKRSKCLKLYCDCFASRLMCRPGECKCLDCRNNADKANEVDRAKALKKAAAQVPVPFLRSATDVIDDVRSQLRDLHAAPLLRIGSVYFSFLGAVGLFQTMQAPVTKAAGAERAAHGLSPRGGAEGNATQSKRVEAAPMRGASEVRTRLSAALVLASAQTIERRRLRARHASFCGV